MRKNGVNRELTPIAGGVCAVDGFLANAVVTEKSKTGKADFGLIFSDKRCATACVCASGEKVGAPVKVTRKHSKNGLAQGIVFNSGKANVFQEDGVQVAERICDALAARLKIDRQDFVIASTGAIGESLQSQPFENAAKSLVDGLSSTEENACLVAQALLTDDLHVKHFAYSFMLGDVQCRIGAVCKGALRVCPNMATTLCFITTDVNISSQMLKKALLAKVKDTFNLLNADGISSPNDTLCVMANGKAGNWKIENADSEYKKFADVLEKVLMQACKEIAKESGKLLTCTVGGAKSKQDARALAKALVGTSGVKNMLIKGRADITGLLYAVTTSGVEADEKALRMELRTDTQRLVLYEDGRAVTGCDGVFGALAKDDVAMFIELGAGNYKAMAYGSFS